MDESQILENLNEPQRAAVTNTEGPLLVLAGAGSGKTKTIVHRIAYLIHVRGVPPEKIVAVTFTNKAAQEMRDRVLNVAGPSGLGCVVRTYHSLGMFFLRQLAGYIDYPSDFTIWDDTDQIGIISSVLQKRDEPPLTKTQLRYLANQINSYKDSLISPAELSEKVDLEAIDLGEIMEEVYHLYEQKKIESRAMDFADLIYQTVKIFQQFPEALERFHRRYRYFLVDEYQDTNHSQYMMISLLASGYKNLCVVGDDDQAIYTWRGADINNILDFTKDFPEALSVKLEENYRSVQPVLDIANAIIANNKNRMGKNLWTSKKSGALPTLQVVTSDLDEASLIARQVSSAINEGVVPDEIAVLYRTNAQSRLLEESFLSRNIKYRVYGGLSFFARKEVKDTLAYMKFLANPFDEVSFVRLINTPSRGVGDKTLEKLLEFRNELARQKGAMPDLLTAITEFARASSASKVVIAISELADWMTQLRSRIQKRIDFSLFFEELLEKSGLSNATEEEDRLLGTSRGENLSELKNSMVRYQLLHHDGLLTDYLQEVSLITSAEDENSSEPCVSLMTVHNAKGLEFDTVFIAGLDDGIFPHYLSAGRDDGEEERRLLYVAITRARRQLIMIRARRRMHQGFVQSMHPSIFISEIPEGAFETIDLSQAQPQPAFGGGQNKSWGGQKNYGGSSTRGGAYKKSTIPAGSPYSKISKTGSGSGFSNMVTSGSVQASTSSGESFRHGERVKHPTFGGGRITRIEGSGDSAKVHILFNDGKSRKFILKYTRLEKI